MDSGPNRDTRSKCEHEVGTHSNATLRKAHHFHVFPEFQPIQGNLHSHKFSRELPIQIQKYDFFTRVSRDI